MNFKMWLKAGFYLIAGFLIVLALSVASLSLIAKHVSLKILNDSQLKESTLETIDIRLFAGQLSLRKLVADKDVTRGINVNEVDIDLAWKPLINNTVKINSIAVDGLAVKLQQTEDGSFKVGLEPARKNSPEPAVTGTPAETARWALDVDELTLHNTTISVASADAITHLTVAFDLTLKDLAASTAGEFSVQDLQISNYRILTNERDTLQWDALRISDARLDKKHVGFASIYIDAFEGDVVHDLDPVNSTLPSLLAFAKPYRATPTTQTIDEEIQQEQARPTSINLRFDSSVKDVSYTFAGNLKLQKVALTNFNLALDQHQPLGWDALNLEQIQLSSNRLSLERIQLDSLRVVADILANGEFSITYALQPILDYAATLPNTAPSSAKHINEDTASAQKELQPSSENHEFSWRIGEVALTGTNTLDFSDASIQPTLHKNLNIKQFKTGNLDSAAPEEPTNITALITGDQHEEFALTANATPLLPKLNATTDVKVSHLDLTTFSPYAVNAIGYNITSGQLDLHSSATVTQGQLQSDNNFTFHKLHLAIANPEKAAKTNSFLQLPLDTSLSVLREKGDIIRLDVPVNGGLRDPDFEIRKVVNKALSKAIKSATMTYLQYAIQPWGAALFVGKHLTGKLNAVQFEPITFAVGKAELSNDMQKYLNKLAELLKNKSSLTITACPTTIEQDKILLAEQHPDQDINPQLKQLAKQRLQKVKHYLVTEHNINPNQVVNCLARHTKDAKPTVILAL